MVMMSRWLVGSSSSSRSAYPAPPAAGELADQLVGGKVQFREELVHPLLDAPAVQGVDPVLELLQLRQAGLVQVRVGEPLVLVHQALDRGKARGHHLPHGPVQLLGQLLVQAADDDVVPELQLTAVGLLDPRDEPEQGGLAGAVAADEAHPFAGLDLEGDVPEDELVTEGEGDLVEADEGGHDGPSGIPSGWGGAHPARGRTLVAYGPRMIPDRLAPMDIPGAFDRRTTAEEVTAGLDLTGRNALITGATSGIGLETARVLALRGAHVLVVGRTQAAAQAVCEVLPGRATPLAAELEDFGSVADCAWRVLRLGVALDMLICNAGIMAPRRLERIGGLEKQFVVNHLSHFILVNRLLPLVRAAPAGRIVMVSSSAHRWAPPGGIDFDNLTGEKGYDPRAAYGRSKLANGLMARELARRLSGTTTTANAVHPGLILTNIIRYSPGPVRWLAPLVAPLLRSRIKTIPQGAATTCFVAAHPAVAGVSGRYYADCQVARPEPAMEDDVLAARLWEVSREFTRTWLPDGV
jgi:NAD(P)-dependent dehydrogenase (short-subunit alcohol dehydrogenase family)